MTMSTHAEEPQIYIEMAPDTNAGGIKSAHVLRWCKSVSASEGVCVVLNLFVAYTQEQNERKCSLKSFLSDSVMLKTWTPPPSEDERKLRGSLR